VAGFVEIGPAGAVGTTPQTITFTSNPPADIGPGATYDVTATASSNLPVTFSTPSASVCTINGSTVTLTATGTCEIDANQAGDATYAAAPEAKQLVGSSNGNPYHPPSNGYWLVGSDGGIFTFGDAKFYGSTGSIALQRPVVGITQTASADGYWLVASDGGVFAFGDASFVGSIPGLGLAPAGTNAPKHLNAPIVGMVPSVTGQGYFMVAADGGVFAFGDAQFEGSCPGIGGCSGTAVGVAPDTSGHGYWLATSTGNVYAFGDAATLTETGTPNSFGPITSIESTPDGTGYWLLNAAGGVICFGDAPNLGSLPANSAGGFDPATAIFRVGGGAGYWIVTALGKVYAFGVAPNDGDMSGTKLNGPIIAATGF
jgi:hypothetical protein